MIAYSFRRGLYLNLTERCPTACVFCVKNSWKRSFRGRDLRLPGGEPSAEQTWREAETRILRSRPRELVFCGYGESTYRLPALRDIAARARKKFPDISLRLNTIGLGSLIWGRDIVPEVSGFLDAVSVSLNTADPGQWLRLHRPREEFKEYGFPAAVEFIHRCARAGLQTTVTAVDLPEITHHATARLAQALGAGFRLRPRLGPATPARPAVPGAPPTSPS